MKAPNWESWKLAHAYPRIGSGTTPTSTSDAYYSVEEGVPWVTTAELRENYIEKTASNVTKEALQDFSALRIYKPGSLMIAMYGATIGRLGITTMPSTCNQACCVFECSEQFDNRFLFYWLWHRRSDLIALSTGGGQPNLSQQDLREERAYCPPIETQRRIAQFLDEKTARIDGLLEKKRALLDRLAEKRQALITRAVTRGISDLVHDKDDDTESAETLERGIWESWKLAHAYPRIGSGTTPTSTSDRYYSTEGGTPWITTAELRENYIGKTASNVTNDALSEYSTLRVYKPGSLFIAMYGATIGRLGISTVPATCNQACCVFEESKVLDNRFLFYWLWHRRADLISLSVGGGQPNLSQQDLREERAYCPPLKVQRRIVQFLDEMNAGMDEQERRIERSIALLNEYRSALITAAVTGEIGGLQ